MACLNCDPASCKVCGGTRNIPNEVLVEGKLVPCPDGHWHLRGIDHKPEDCPYPGAYVTWR